MSLEDRIIATVLGLDPLADLPRTGWLLRGVRPCESLAEHTYGVSLVALLLTDALRAEGQVVDGERVLRMAIVHDATEVATGDIPAPSKPSLRELEQRLATQLLPETLLAAWQEAERGESLEARVVKAADKLQMMIKVLAYESQGRGQLEEFWQNPANFRTAGLPMAERLFSRICERAGRRLPLPGSLSSTA
jgi:putative hydrolase of HD superfamily